MKDNKKTINYDYLLNKLKFEPNVEPEGAINPYAFFYQEILFGSDFLAHHTHEECVEIGLELLPLIPQEYYDTTVSDMSGPVAVVTLAFIPSLKDHPCYHRLVEQNLERTKNSGTINTKLISSYPLTHALKKGAKLEVIKKLIELSSVKFTYNQYHKFYDGEGALKYPYTMAKYPDEKDFSNYSPKETKEIKELIIEKFENLREKAKSPITSKLKSVASKFSNMFKTTSTNNPKGSQEFRKDQPTQKNYSQIENQKGSQQKQPRYC